MVFVDYGVGQQGFGVAHSMIIADASIRLYLCCVLVYGASRERGMWIYLLAC